MVVHASCQNGNGACKTSQRRDAERNTQAWKNLSSGCDLKQQVTMEREYIRGNRKHWKEVYKYVYGIEPETFSQPDICNNDKSIFVKDKVGGFVFYTDEIVYDAITTNPNWHEVKPWENKPYEPKPFDKVLGWDDDWNVVRPDIFLYNIFGEYICANSLYKHVKPYNEEEYLKSSEWYYGKE